MSSQVNIYIVTKREEQEEKLLLTSYGSSSVVYEYLHDEITYAYGDKGEVFTSLKPNLLYYIIDEIEKTIQSNNERIAVYYKLKMENSVDNICALQDRNKELEAALNAFNMYLSFAQDIAEGLSIFKDIVANYD